MDRCHGQVSSSRQEEDRERKRGERCGGSRCAPGVPRPPSGSAAHPSRAGSGAARLPATPLRLGCPSGPPARLRASWQPSPPGASWQPSPCQSGAAARQVGRRSGGELLEVDHVARDWARVGPVAPGSGPEWARLLDLGPGSPDGPRQM
jgi:hypothetical protein